MKLEQIFHKQHDLKTFQPAMKANGAIVINRPQKTEDLDLVQLVHQENIRLQQQLLIEREYHETWRQGKELAESELIQTNKEKKDLERKIKLLQSFKDMKKRRSWNLANHYLYEGRIQILLNELESMEVEESKIFEKLNFKRNECQELKAKLEFKEQEIKQLVYELQTKNKN
ncbi:hypothetical protein G6F56_005082 [Rhizopus delemar]|nr:hypothetical protein G6F56_005082 [Rhizopus delemar]